MESSAGTEIEEIISKWAQAVRDEDLAAIRAHHAEDFLMFDVPPPDDVIRGLESYRETWPPFFEWQAQAVFEIQSLEVVVGQDVAFAYALLRCGSPADFARNPELRLRLTVGLRKVDGRWLVLHEHHSFPDRTPPAENLAPTGS